MQAMKRKKTAFYWSKEVCEMNSLLVKGKKKLKIKYSIKYPKEDQVGALIVGLQ